MVIIPRLRSNLGDHGKDVLIAQASQSRWTAIPIIAASNVDHPRCLLCRLPAVPCNCHSQRPKVLRLSQDGGRAQINYGNARRCDVIDTAQTESYCRPAIPRSQLVLAPRRRRVAKSRLLQTPGPEREGPLQHRRSQTGKQASREASKGGRPTPPTLKPEIETSLTKLKRAFVARGEREEEAGGVRSAQQHADAPLVARAKLVPSGKSPSCASLPVAASCCPPAAAPARQPWVRLQA